MPFARLDIVFSVNGPEETALKKIMEEELGTWIKRYPVHLMVSAFDADDNLLVSADFYERVLFGWIDDENKITTSWRGADFSAAVKKNPVNKPWPDIYTDVPYKTAEEIKAENAAARKDMIKGNKALKIVLSLWLVAIPAGWAIYQTFGPKWIGWIAISYVLWKAFSVAGRIWGIKKLSENQLKQVEKEREKEHHHHHCKLNPEGFIRLRNENFLQDVRNINKEEFDKIMS